ncbi:hypothetical protein LSAT2_021689 [Lamellibrachia satsuma]|nr:hypothetical protein LSAT2_021689 [Lamellibrachia satsuma]
MVTARWEGVTTHTAYTSALASITRNFPVSEQQSIAANYPRLRCPFCMAWFFGDVDMNRHLADSHGIIDNSCYLCKRQFPNVQELAQHLMEEHSVDRNLTCRLCGVTLKTKSQFVTHLSKHAQVKPFKCSYCEKAYYSLQHLVRHKRSCFGIENPFPCSHCDKCYRSQQRLKEHIDAVHCGKKFLCGVCGRSFNWRNNYRNHMKVCTGPSLNQNS